MIHLTPGLYLRLLNSKKLLAEWSSAWYKTIVLIRLRTRVYITSTQYLLLMCEDEPLKYLCELMEDLLTEDPQKHLYAIRRITHKIKPGQLGTSTPENLQLFQKEINDWNQKGGINAPAEITELNFLPFIGKMQPLRRYTKKQKKPKKHKNPKG